MHPPVLGPRHLDHQHVGADPADAAACGRAFATNPLCGLLVLVAVLAGRVGTLG
ncbi:hypothetical protein ABTX35_40670 [Streptomyces sp. NPDC096080]|uniref:hypothetical protein n=1 Tax=Streptomyces sp. NPDC096080 TaxID=3156693 RepID=UPI00332E3F54